MNTPKTNPNKQDRAKAKTTLECYHQGNTTEDTALRNELYFHIMILITTSPWWLSIHPEKKDAIMQHMVQSFDKDAALDVMYN